jgi:hypothetical protein
MTATPLDQPTPPIFVDDHGDISVFRSVGFAESWMEAIDIENEEYTAYDASGRLLALSADRRQTHIALAEEEPTHSSELAQKLQKFLRAVKDPVRRLHVRPSPLGCPLWVPICRRSILAHQVI